MMQDSDNPSLVWLLKRLETRSDGGWLPRGRGPELGSGLFSVLWPVLERRYANRGVPKKVRALRAQLAENPWPTLLALAGWLERREPELARHVAEHFAAVRRVLSAAPGFDIGALLRRGIRELKARRFSRGKPKAAPARFSEEALRAFYECLYEDFDTFEQKAKSEGWGAAINGQFGIYGEDRPPSSATLWVCEDYSGKRASRYDVCLQIAADLGNRSPETLAKWKSLRGLPPWTLTRHRKPQGRSARNCFASQLPPE